MAGKNRAKNSVFIDKTGETLATASAINAVNDALTSHIESIKNLLNEDKSAYVNLVDRYSGVISANQFIMTEGSPTIIIPSELVNKYSDYDIVVYNSTDTAFRFAIRTNELVHTSPTIRMADGSYTRFETGISDKSSQIIIPSKVYNLNISQIPITNAVNGTEAYDNHIWKKYRGELLIQMRAIQDSDAGFVSVWFVGYKK